MNSVLERELLHGLSYSDLRKTMPAAGAVLILVGIWQRSPLGVLLGSDPKQTIAEDLHRFKALMEMPS